MTENYTDMLLSVLVTSGGLSMGKEGSLETIRTLVSPKPALFWANRAVCPSDSVCVGIWESVEFSGWRTQVHTVDK